MGLAGTAVAECDHVLAAINVRAPCQVQDQHFVERRNSLEVEALQALNRREPSLSDPPLDHPALTIDQFQFGKAQQIPDMIGAFCGTLASQFVVLTQEGRQLEGLELMSQSYRRIVLPAFFGPVLELV